MKPVLHRYNERVRRKGKVFHCTKCGVQTRVIQTSPLQFPKQQWLIKGFWIGTRPACIEYDTFTLGEGI